MAQPRRGLLPLLIGALALTVAGCSSGAGSSAPTPTTSTQSARSDDELARLLRAEEPGCAAAVGVEGSVAWAGARGLADLSTKGPLTPDSLFDIASVSKQFTAAAILLLAQSGRLKLTDPLAAHVDGLPGWSRQVTIDHLVHHTSGIPDYTGLLVAAGFSLTERTTQTQAIRALVESPALGAEPGARFEYSNSNYVLLAEVVRAASGTPLPDYLRSNIFEPLHLDMRMDPLATGPLVATSYTKDGVEWRAADSAWTQLGDGSVHASVTSLVRWADNYRTGAVGGRRLLSDQIDGAVATEPGGGRYGAGIAINPDNTLSHEGAWGGFVTLFGISADRRTSIAVSCNTSAVDIGAIAGALQRIWT